MARRVPKKIQSPFFLRHGLLTLIVTALMCVLCYFLIDKPLAGYFRTLSPPIAASLRPITYLIDPETSYFLWPILYFLLRYTWNKEIWANRALLILISIPVMNLTVDIIKTIAARARPGMLFSEGLYGFTFFSISSHFGSFPSGHACTIGVICGALACFYPNKSLPLTILALVLACSRVALNFHYLSDVIFGVAIGLIGVQWIFVTMKRKPFQFVLR